MSIYIQGMEMPKNKPLLVKINPDGSVSTTARNGYRKYEAVSVQPHGRLIESKAFLKVAYETDDFSLDELAHLAVLVAATPTIIPAPAEEE